VNVSAVERLKPALPAIPDRGFNLADFGGVGDGRTMNTDAFKRAIAAVESAGIIHGLTDSPITHITLRDITLTAEKDFDVRDAEMPAFERVTRTIKPGVAPARIPGGH
jgi:hypothetical protein